MIPLVRFTSPQLTAPTAKFISVSNVLGGVRAYDRVTLSGRGMHDRAAAHLVGARKSTQRRPLPRDCERWLRIAWQTELSARVSDQFDDDLLRRVAAQTLPVQAYYSIFNAARAATSARGTTCNTHQAVHRDYQANRVRYGYGSWGTSLTGDPENLTTCVLSPQICKPVAFNPMELSHASEEYVFAALRMTRRWKVEKARADWLRTAKTATGKPRKQLPAAERSKLLHQLRATTLLDFIYELRVRTNYEGVEEYGSDADDSTVEQFHRGLLHMTDTGLLHYETDLACTIGAAAYQGQVIEWIRSTAKAGSWARQPVERRLNAILKVCPVP